MTRLADLLSTVFERRYGLPWAAREDDRPLPDLTAELIGARGEVSGLAVAHSILERYRALDDAGKLGFFRHLAEDRGVTPGALRQALDSYEAGQTKTSYRALMAAAEPPRQELIRRLNQVPGATAALVRMRADLLRLGRGEDALEALDLDFRHLFASWFNRGFLVLRRIDWDSAASVLEKLIVYEAVHEIRNWDDLRGRVEPSDRRCYAFFHPAMAGEPLIFVEVALTAGVPGSVQGLLAPDRPVLAAGEADTAVFYSISNCQAGLAHISFGNSLIKQVAADLSLDLPGLKTFVTLSPIPGLSDWLRAEAIAHDPENDAQMRALAARYLTQAKRSDGLPRDPVARFHLGNGALVQQIHARADLSEKGRVQSAGTMVNYLYDLAKVSQNHERYAAAREIAMSPEIRSLARAADKARA